eukprot:COSAG02_NODE_2857_length_7888_cov_4.283220_3_plen_87_part_00
MKNVAARRKMRVTVGAVYAPTCQQRSAPPDAVEDAPSLDPWLKATSGGRLATYGPGDGAACEVLILCGEFLRGAAPFAWDSVHSLL